MIGTSLAYLLKQVNSFVGSQNSKSRSASDPGRVVFPAGNQAGTLLFPPDKISMLLVNIEEERVQRSLDVYSHRTLPGRPNQLLRKMPSIRLSLHVLFVACFADYVTAWNQLSDVILGFQLHPIFSPEHNPDFPATMEMITTELISQSLKDQRDLWATLGTCQQPAVLYRFRLLTLEPREDQPVARVETVDVAYQRQ
jgi:hypothetical protein